MYQDSKVWTQEPFKVLPSDNKSNSIIFVALLISFLIMALIGTSGPLVYQNRNKSDLVMNESNKLKNIQIYTRHNLLNIDIDDTDKVVKFIREQSISNGKFIMLEGFSRDISYKELVIKSIIMEYFLMNFATLMYVFSNDRKQLKPHIKHMGKGFLDSFVRELSHTLTISNELNSYFIQNTIYKITTFLGMYISWNHNDHQVALEAARAINTKLNSLYMPTNLKFEYKGIIAGCNLFGFIMARILDSKMSLNNTQDLHTYKSEKKIFELKSGDSILCTNKSEQSSLIWEVQINKDLGFKGALPIHIFSFHI